MDKVGIERLTGAFVLPPGWTLRPAAELPSQLRREIGAAEGQYALSRANARTYSKIVDPEGAMLVREFQTPTTIAQALARFSRAHDIDAQQLLDDALPFLLSLITSGLLIAANGTPAGVASLAVGTIVEGWQVVRCVQTIEDTEVYQARDENGRFGALKIARPSHEPAARGVLHETKIRRAVSGAVSPPLLTSGWYTSRPFFIADWFNGSHAEAVCAQLRQNQDRETLFHLTAAILRAFAALHERQIIHGDVQPNNILIDRQGNVRIIDFGLARYTGKDGHSPGRGGVSFFFEPEFAKAMLAQTWPGPATASGEQYALAALIYLLLTGSHYIDFSLEKHAMLQRIAEATMVPFTQRGIAAWPEAEAVLRKALEKNSSDRFPSVADFAQAWAKVRIGTATRAGGSKDWPTSSTVIPELIQSTTIASRFFRSGPMPAPSTSVTYGSAGLAYALSRIAAASENPELFAAADAWSQKAIREIGNADAFYSDAVGITPDRVGPPSIYHGPAGVHAIAALLALERGDAATQKLATNAFVETARSASEIVDVTLGYAGTLLGTALLFDAFGDAGGVLHGVGSELMRRLLHKLQTHGPMGPSGAITTLGIAHGWGGLLYAALAWSVATREPVAGIVNERLIELASQAEPVGRGLQWKIAIPSDGQEVRYHTGWCNGSAGFVFLWTLTHHATRNGRYLELAEGAAWNAWERLSPNPSLCCGAAGQAYALLNFYRHSGDAIWLQRAKCAADAAARASASQAKMDTDSPEVRPTSLYKGVAGVAVLAAELEAPEQARMPMFELL